jgi:hypothetical protein
MKRLEILEPLIYLRTENDFYVVRILQRKKDNPELEYSEKQLKVYTFYSWQEFDKQKNRIKEICDLNNARAYLRLNTQNAVTISMLMQKEIIDNILNNCAWKNEGVWNSVSGKGGSKDWWVIDMDAEHLHLKDDVIKELKKHYKDRKTYDRFSEINPISNFPIFINTTKSGIHIICKPFDTRVIEKFNTELSSQGTPTIVIQKDANTVLYIGNE